jgi:hypothetical protein
MTREGLYRYVTHNLVPDYLRLGWMAAADLGPIHGQWSILMFWSCGCAVREPARAA